ncbi:hypothetical protein EV652_105270 [Kribbella steppae]|uniref:Uncharacterized protein n=1 Tax=Kribbella steppae TaxID=2512223 RepID=A0A4V2S050_9ACTN|nr:hypothetical protein EV652_105270 [Kribbella steppae]
MTRRAGGVASIRSFVLPLPTRSRHFIVAAGIEVVYTSPTPFTQIW